MPYLTLNSSHFIHNCNIIQNIVSNRNKIAIVLKDNAYGHGLEQIAHLAQQSKIKTAFVKHTKEALNISQYFDQISILYPDFVDDTFQQALLQPHFYFCINAFEHLKLCPPQTKIELKCNSGLNRNGIPPSQIKQAFELINKQQLNLKGIFTHNGYGDGLGSEFYVQNQCFLQIKKEVLKLCQSYGFAKPRFHSLSSSGTFREAKNHQTLPHDLQDNLYRIGLAFYGYLQMHPSFSINPPLKPIASLYAKKISSHAVKKGARIGYNGEGVIEQDGMISSYDIGYGDGLFRLREKMHLTTKEGFFIFPKSSMDCLSIQSQEQEVCIFNDVSAWAAAFQTIPYEILVHLHPYIPKKIV